MKQSSKSRCSIIEKHGTAITSLSSKKLHPVKVTDDSLIHVDLEDGAVFRRRQWGARWF
jgi:hypothetical protein